MVSLIELKRWKIQGQHEDSEWLKLFCSDIKGGRKSCHFENLQNTFCSRNGSVFRKCDHFNFLRKMPFLLLEFVPCSKTVLKNLSVMPLHIFLVVYFYDKQLYSFLSESADSSAPHSEHLLLIHN